MTHTIEGGGFRVQPDLQIVRHIERKLYIWSVQDVGIESLISPGPSGPEGGRYRMKGTENNGMKSNAGSSSASVKRALAILEAVASRSSGMSNSEISRKLEIPKSSASYILRTLEKCGYLYRDAEGKYLLGLKLLNLG